MTQLLAEIGEGTIVLLLLVGFFFIYMLLRIQK